jgi:hypothetical protein
MASGIVKMLVAVLLLLLNHVAFAANPKFAPGYGKTGPQYQLIGRIMRQAWEDAVTLARVVVRTGSDCDEVRAPLTNARVSLLTLLFGIPRAFCGINFPMLKISSESIMC